MITSSLRRQRPSARRFIHSCLRVAFSRLDITDKALGSASGSGNNLVAKRRWGKQSSDGVRNLVRIEPNLWFYGQNPLTTRRFPRKINTHFYHARPATWPVRTYKQCAGHSSIPDPAGAGLRSLLAPYDDTTSY
jgi:hypothetical protein